MIFSAYWRLPAIASLLTLAAALTGCQGLQGRSGGEPAPQGTLSASPTTLSFGDVVVGQSASLTGNLRASGATVRVSSAASTSTEFAVSGVSFPASLDAGESLSYTVTFKPQSSGAVSATVSFVSNADDSPELQSESGTGIPAPQHRVDLSWNASQSAGVVGYNVYRGTGGKYSRINDALEASTHYTDFEVKSGTSYFYVVTAVAENAAESGNSEPVTALIPTP